MRGEPTLLAQHWQNRVSGQPGHSRQGKRAWGVTCCGLLCLAINLFRETLGEDLENLLLSEHSITLVPKRVGQRCKWRWGKSC